MGALNDRSERQYHWRDASLSEIPDGGQHQEMTG
jgi:hypothetical protein